MGVVTGPRGPLLNFWALSKTRELGIAKYKYGVLINHGDYWRIHAPERDVFRVT